MLTGYNMPVYGPIAIGGAIGTGLFVAWKRPGDAREEADDEVYHADMGGDEHAPAFFYLVNDHVRNHGVGSSSFRVLRILSIREP